jgi:putative ABC transport system permease protein
MGGALGWLIGHGAVWAAGGYVEELTGVRLGIFDFAPPSPDIFTLMLTVFGWLLIGTGVIVATVAWLWAVILALRDRRAWALAILIPPMLLVLGLVWCLGNWNQGRSWLAAIVLGILFSFAGVGLVYLAGQGLFLPAGEAIPPELVLIPALVLLAIAVGFMPAITAYRTDVAKSLQ